MEEQNFKKDNFLTRHSIHSNRLHNNLITCDSSKLFQGTEINVVTGETTNYYPEIKRLLIIPFMIYATPELIYMNKINLD